MFLDTSDKQNVICSYIIYIIWIYNYIIRHKMRAKHQQTVYIIDKMWCDLML